MVKTGINEVYRQGGALCSHHGNHNDKDESRDFSNNQCIHSVF